MSNKINGDELLSTINVTRLCVATTMLDMSDGQWFPIRCRQRMETTAVICQRNVDANYNTTTIIKRSINECKFYELSLSQYCLKKTKPFNKTISPLTLDNISDLNVKEHSIFSHYLSINSIRKIALVYPGDRCECYTSVHVFLDIPVYHDMSYFVDRCNCDTVSLWMLFRKPIYIDITYCEGNSLFRCTDGTCILSRYMCDELRDCPDSSDETGDY